MKESVVILKLTNGECIIGKILETYDISNDSQKTIHISFPLKLGPFPPYDDDNNISYPNPSSTPKSKSSVKDIFFSPSSSNQHGTGAVDSPGAKSYISDRCI